MLPKDNVYGTWPRSGKLRTETFISILQYSWQVKLTLSNRAGMVFDIPLGASSLSFFFHPVLTDTRSGSNYVQGALNWGPSPELNGVSKSYSWWTDKRRSFGNDFHTYVLEWTDKFL